MKRIRDLTDLFLGATSASYKITLLAFLLSNIVFINTIGPFWTTVIMLVQFLYCLFKSTDAYPALTGGLLVIQGVLLGLLPTSSIWHELQSNFDVLMLVLYMVAAIYFLKELITYVFVNMFVAVRNKVALSFIVCLSAAVLSAFLDALTVTVVVMTVIKSLYDIVLDFRAGKSYGDSSGGFTDAELRSNLGPQIKDFRKFLASVVIHALIGTALGGVMTQVGEPQNVMLVKMINNVLEGVGMPLWDFNAFFAVMIPVTIPTIIMGLVTTITLERFKLFGFGSEMTEEEREVLTEWRDAYQAKMSKAQKSILVVQGIVVVLLVVMLVTHFAEVGVIGLFIMILAAVFTAKRDEHDFVPAFHEGGPFLVVLGVLFAFVAMLHEQHTFQPVVDYAMTLGEHAQKVFFFLASGILSAGSDNVFVAKVFMDAATGMYETITVREAVHLESLTVSINAGTNIFSVLTPNGQAAFLFFLTSALAKERLLMGWKEIFLLTLPYAVVMIITSLLCIMYLL